LILAGALLAQYDKIGQRLTYISENSSGKGKVLYLDKCQIFIARFHKMHNIIYLFQNLLNDNFQSLSTDSSKIFIFVLFLYVSLLNWQDFHTFVVTWNRS